MIEFSHVTKKYIKGGVAAVDDLSLEIPKGQFVFVTGDSGAGKSTVLKLLLKEIEPTNGEITVSDKKLSSIGHSGIPEYRRMFGMVFQDFRLLEDRNIYENVAFAMRVVEARRRDIKKKVPQMLSLVGLASKYKARPKELSGGEQQRVAIARALINTPKILLADEPTGNLDSKNAWGIMNLLEEINELGTTVVVVSHNQEIVRAMNKRVISLKKGVMVGDRGGELL